MIVDECSSDAKKIASARPPASTATTSTPSKTKTKAPLVSFTSPRTESQQTSITHFFEKIASKVDLLQNMPIIEDETGEPNFLPDHGNARRRDSAPTVSPARSDADSLSDDEERLHEATIERRKDAGSTASNFLGEAFNHRSCNDDSQLSKVTDDSVIKDSDEAFLGSSIEEDERRHPGALHVQLLIKEATKGLKTKPAAKEPKAPKGWCPKGHLIDLRTTFPLGKKLKCNACLQMVSQDLFSCHCYRYHACLACLTKGNTHPPPPECPNLECSAICKFQFKPIITQCFHGRHPIPANDHAWICSEKTCRAIICVDCRIQRNQSVNAETSCLSAPITDTFQHSRFDQLNSSSATQASHPSESPNPFLSPTRHTTSPSSSQKGQATPMLRDRA